MTYEPKDTDDIRETPAEVLDVRLDDPALGEVDIIGALVTAFAKTLSEEQEEELASIDKQSKLATATGEDLTQKAAEYGIERRDPVRATGVLKFSRSSDATTDYTIPEGTRVQTNDGSVGFQTTEEVVLAQGTQSVKANARADEGGTDGNLAAHKLTTLVSPPSGVEGVTNPDPTGDETKTDTDGNPLVPGRERETDEELRERTFASTSIGGAATTGAIRTAVLDVDGVRSVTTFPNPTDSTDADGLPPYSNEVIVAGGQLDDIATTLKETVSVTELFRLQTGIIGTKPSSNEREVYVEALDDYVTVDFSRPVTVSLDISMDIVTTDNYVGDDTIKDRMVGYVGGADTSGADESGLGAGSDVILARLKDTIVGSDTGVDGVTSMTVDTDGDGNDDRTTNGDGLDVIAIAQEEQAFLDATNISITEV